MGQQFFEQYSPEILGILGFYSLPYCYAAEAGSKVLVQSKYLVENPEKRLRETGEFLIHTNSVSSFKPKGLGLVAILRVRLMHAWIRRQCLNNGHHEMPVNQEDLVGTNLSFSIIVLRGLRKIGIDPKESSFSAYMYLWKVIGEMLGIQDKLLPQEIQSASILERAIRNRQFRENKEGRILVNALVGYFENQEFLKNVDVSRLISAFVGPQVSKYLGLGAPNLSMNAVLGSVGILNFFKDYSSRNFGLIRRRLQKELDLQV